MSKLKEVKELIIPEPHWTKQRDENVQSRRDKKLTKNHLRYIKAIEDNLVVVCTGPAGTAKTHLASKIACEHLTQNKIKRIVITRPIVECDEELGILPGDMAEKMQPYLAPLEEALKKYLGYDYEKYKKNGCIEICPLAVMRGKTFDDAFIILDEAQNCTFTQIRMIMTRLGENSKLIITGDTEQVDLKTESPLLEVVDRIMSPPKHKQIEHIMMESQDCLRPMIIQFIDNRLSRDYRLYQNKDIEDAPTYGKTKFNQN